MMNDYKRISKLAKNIDEILSFHGKLSSERKDVVAELMAVALTFAMETLEEGTREYMKALHEPIAPLPMYIGPNEDRFKNEYHCIPFPPDEEKK